MKKRILACLFIVAVLPSMTVQTQRRPATRGPFAAVAMAGHTVLATRSECTCELLPDGGCPCCGYNINFIRAQDDVADDDVIQLGLSASAQSDSNSDLGPGAVLFLLALIAWGTVLA